MTLFSLQPPIQTHYTKVKTKVNDKVKKTVTSAKKVTIKKLKGGKKAKFQIVAFNAEGVKAASKVKSVKIKK